MTTAQLIPTPDLLQVPWGWFQILLTVTFFCHLLVMNILLGCSIINFARHATGRTSSLNRAIGKKLPLTIAFTINFGVAPLLFLQVLYGHLMYVSSVLMAVFWLSIFLILMFSYYAAYVYTIQYERITAFHTLLSGCIAGSLLLVAFIMTSNLALMTDPQSWGSYFANPRGLFLNLSDPTLVPRFLHSVLGSVAVGGLSIALYYDYQKRRGIADTTEQIAVGMNWFVGATMLNFGIGTWYLGSLPDSVRSLSGEGSVFFLIFVLLGILSIFLSLIHGMRQQVRTSAWYLLATLSCMVLVREFSRRMTLAPWFKTSDLEVVSQYSPLFVFLLVFAGGIGLIIYMIRLVVCDKEVRS